LYLVSVASKREPLEWKRAGTKLVVAGGSKVVNSELFYNRIYIWQSLGRGYIDFWSLGPNAWHGYSGLAKLGLTPIIR